MKITKFVQSCVLVQDDKYVALFDPDSFTWGSKTFPLDSLQKLDYILITHIHGDHFSLEFVQALINKFPSAKIFTTNEIATSLKQAGIKNVSTESDNVIEIANATHENMTPLTGHPNNENIAITFDGKVTHPGDSHQFQKSGPILLLPVDGPWGSTAGAVLAAEKVKPRFILPIHDAMYTDQWRALSYDWVEEFCKQHKITFLRPEAGKELSVNL